MAYDPLTHRRLIVCDARHTNADGSVTLTNPTEIVVPIAEARGRRLVTAQDWIDLLDAEPDIGAADKSNIVRKARPGMRPAERLRAIVNELRASPRAAAWRDRRRVQDAQPKEHEAEAR